MFTSFNDPKASLLITHKEKPEVLEKLREKAEKIQADLFESVGEGEPPSPKKVTETKYVDKE